MGGRPQRLWAFQHSPWTGCATFDLRTTDWGVPVAAPPARRLGHATRNTSSVVP